MYCLISNFVYQLVTEKDSAFIKPKIEINKVVIGGGGGKSFLSCIQLYDKALDESLIKVLDVCRNRHGKLIQ